MIFDSLTNLGQYASLHPDILKAIACLRNPEFLQQPDGRYPLCEQSYMTLQSYQTKPLSQTRFEVHQAYADIQILLSGKELISCAPSDAFHTQTAYDTQADIAFGDAIQPVVDLHMSQKNFALFWPGEPHRPCILWEDAMPVRKVVIKLCMLQWEQD